MSAYKTRLWTYSLPVALLLLAPFNILASLGMDIYLPVVPAMPGILGTSSEVVQLTLTLYMIMLGVGQVVFGPLSDRLGRRPVLILGAIIFVITSFALAGTSSAGLFVLLRLVQAIGASAMLVALFATIRDVYAIMDRDRAVALSQTVGLERFRSDRPSVSTAKDVRLACRHTHVSAGPSIEADSV
ncbi:MFS transporter [Brevundimonas sp. S1H14]|uniref:MFS transporter n=1 Tax=Brevundimonas sp. S1H14 TaxID=3078084 RepID=UPI0039EA4A8D